MLDRQIIIEDEEVPTWLKDVTPEKEIDWQEAFGSAMAKSYFERKIKRRLHSKKNM